MRSVTKNFHKVNKGDEIKVEFSGKNLTSFGGMKLFAGFLKKLGVERRLNSGVKIAGRRESRYSVGRLLVSLIYGFVVDLHKLSDTVALRTDRVFLKIVEFTRYPHQTTFSRFLEKFSVSVAKEIGVVNVKLLRKVRNNFKGLKKLTLDLDSHVKTVYGNQQRAKVGFNPKKPGRKSYHPVFCFIGETRDFLWGRFRSGKSYSGKGAKDFLRECLKLVPKGIEEIFLRGDSSFYDKEFLEYIERKGIMYAIVAKLYTSIQAILTGVSYVPIGGGKEAGEFQYRAPDWKKPRRMVVIRERVEVGKEKKQLKLFELQGYDYQVIVTDIEEKTPEEVWRFYNGRANVENMIKEGMLGYGLDVCVSHWYGGNMAHFFLVMLSYNLMNWFKESILEQKDRKKMAKWIRMRMLLIPGRLVKTGRRWFLKLSSAYPWQSKYWRAEEKLKILQFAG